MDFRRVLPACVALLAASAALTACAQQSSTQAASTPRVPTAQPAQATAPATSALPLVVVHKRPTCGCCGQWVEHMREAGFTVEVRNTNNINPVKERLGVPYGKGSCHTAEVGGDVVEGHVPADDVKRLLAQQLDAKGYRKSVAEGNSGSVSVDLGGRRILKKKKHKHIK